MSRRRHPAALHWVDVDPATHALSAADIDSTRAMVVARLSSLTRPAFDDHRWRHEWEEAIDDVIMERHGEWSSGWRWSGGEGSIGGGVVRQWCCEQHSLVGTLDEMAGRAVGGLQDWRAWLTYLQQRFAMLALHADDVAGRLRFGITQVLADVADATGAEDAWYLHAEQVLCWYLEFHGASSSQASHAVHAAARGHFHSWCTPAPEVQDAIGADVATSLNHAALNVIGRKDDLARHRIVRAQIDWSQAPTIPAHSGIDGHARYIDDVDAKRDRARATRMRAAVRSARQSAGGGTLVDLDLLTSLHAIAVPAVDLRAGPAWAKQGHEQYGITATLRADFNDALGEADDVDVPVIARAARAYLDVCFFHVFNDGNARAARVLFDFILAREGIVLHDVAGLFRHPIAAGDVDSARSFLSLCSTLALSSARRSEESAHGL